MITNVMMKKKMMSTFNYLVGERTKQILMNKLLFSNCWSDLNCDEFWDGGECDAHAYDYYWNDDDDESQWSDDGLNPEPL